MFVVAPSRPETRRRPGPCRAATRASVCDALQRRVGPAPLLSGSIAMRQAQAPEHRPDRRQRARLDPALDQDIPDLGKRDPLMRRCELAQQILVPGKQRPAPPYLRRPRAASLAHAANRLDCSRWPPLERTAAPRAELRSLTARTKRFRKTWDEGAVTQPRCSTSILESDLASPCSNRKLLQ